MYSGQGWVASVPGRAGIQHITPSHMTSQNVEFSTETRSHLNSIRWLSCEISVFLPRLHNWNLWNWQFENSRHELNMWTKEFRVNCWVLTVMTMQMTNQDILKICWGVCTIKTRVMPSMPTKSDACTSTSWLLGDIFTAKSCKGEKRVPDAFKLGPTSWGRQPWQKTLVLQNSLGLGVGLTTPPCNTIIVTKPSKKEVRPKPTPGCSAEEEEEEYPEDWGSSFHRNTGNDLPDYKANWGSVACLRVLIVGFPPRRPCSIPGQVICHLWWINGTGGGFIRVIRVSPVTYHSAVAHSYRLGTSSAGKCKGEQRFYYETD
jgi:hypothetical protein